MEFRRLQSFGDNEVSEITKFRRQQSFGDNKILGENKVSETTKFRRLESFGDDRVSSLQSFGHHGISETTEFPFFFFSSALARHPTGLFYANFCFLFKWGKKEKKKNSFLHFSVP